MVLIQPQIIGKASVAVSAWLGQSNKQQVEKAKVWQIKAKVSANKILNGSKGK